MFTTLLDIDFHKKQYLKVGSGLLESMWKMIQKKLLQDAKKGKAGVNQRKDVEQKLGIWRGILEG
jgi:hypothetical protein